MCGRWGGSYVRRGTTQQGLNTLRWILLRVAHMVARLRPEIEMIPRDYARASPHRQDGCAGDSRR
jgi:hypothetical protein